MAEIVSVWAQATFDQVEKIATVECRARDFDLIAKRYEPSLDIDSAVKACTPLLRHSSAEVTLWLRGVFCTRWSKAYQDWTLGDVVCPHSPAASAFRPATEIDFPSAVSQEGSMTVEVECCSGCGYKLFGRC